MTRIGFAGLGIMGASMARNLLKKGHQTTVWNRSAAACVPLAKDGAKVAATPRELAAGNDVVASCLSDPAAVEAVYFGPDGILAGLAKGARVIESSTISPTLARRLGAACEERGAELLEAPVTGSKLGARDGTLLYMTAGKKAVHDELEPIILCMGQKAIYMGGPGMAQSMKLIGNTIISFMVEALAEGLTLGSAVGLEPAKIIEVIQSAAFSSPYWSFKGGAMVRRDFETHFALDLLHKDQTLALAMAQEHKVPMPALAAIREVATAARANGFGGEDIVAVVKALELQAGHSRK
jgi:3-hydroxyisobutyrate dehydrogenase-like beta-hydroxyacid dehydrogenase